MRGGTLPQQQQQHHAAAAANMPGQLARATTMTD